MLCVDKWISLNRHARCNSEIRYCKAKYERKTTIRCKKFYVSTAFDSFYDTFHVFKYT